MLGGLSDSVVAELNVFWFGHVSYSLLRFHLVYSVFCRFSDVVGIDEAKAEVAEIVQYLKVRVTST